MKTFDKEEFKARLLAGKPAYSAVRAARIGDRLDAADGDIQAAALAWVERDAEPAFDAEGWSVARLESKFGMNALAARLTIDWLRKEPQAALAALKEGIK